jgi:hypothetical protein
MRLYTRQNEVMLQGHLNNSGTIKENQYRFDTTEPSMKKRGYIAKDCWFKEKYKSCYNYRKYNAKRRECLKSKQFGLGNFNFSNQ